MAKSEEKLVTPLSLLVDLVLVGLVYSKVTRLARRTDTTYTVATANAAHFPDGPLVVMMRWRMGS